MILNKQTLTQFWQWFESMETIKMYGQYNRIDLWYNPIIENTDSRDFLFNRSVEQKFNHIKYRDEFCQKSNIEKYAIYIDFFDTLGIHYSVMSSPYYGDTPITIEDIPERKFERMFWLNSIIIFDEPELDIVPDHEDNERVFFNSREEATKQGIFLITNYINSKENEETI